MNKRFDFVVVGAGVFGAWTAYHLRQSGATVGLLDAYGPGNSRASSGGETRIIRMGYGPDELYTRLAIRSFEIWREFLENSAPALFCRTGVLWLGREDDEHLRGMKDLLVRCGVKCEALGAEEIRKRYPQLRFQDVTLGVFEPESGVMLARRAVQALVSALGRQGTDVATAVVLPPQGKGRLSELLTGDGGRVSGGTFIFACGPWLPKLFTGVLKHRIFPTRQEVLFFGPPAGTTAFRPERMPAWLHHSHPGRPYALPDIENRGFKISLDEHGDEFDPDAGDRTVGKESVERVRKYLRAHVPGLSEAPLLEARVCQYENTWNGDFLIDRHPDFDNVWLAGGGSGHGFKHGPAVGESLASRILRQTPAEPRFSLASKRTLQARAVF